MKHLTLFSYIMINLLLSSTIMQGSAGYSRKIENWTTKQECQYYQKQCGKLFQGAQFFADKKFKQAQQQARDQNPINPYRNPSRRTTPLRPSSYFLLPTTPKTNNTIFGQ